jgi:serine protease AprX
VTANSRKFDRVNNVEQLVWRNLPVGDVHIVVRAWRVTQFPQSYALAARLQ